MKKFLFIIFWVVVILGGSQTRVQAACNCTEWVAKECSGGGICGTGWMYKTRYCPNNCADQKGCFYEPAICPTNTVTTPSVSLSSCTYEANSKLVDTDAYGRNIYENQLVFNVIPKANSSKISDIYIEFGRDKSVAANGSFAPASRVIYRRDYTLDYSGFDLWYLGFYRYLTDGTSLTLTSTYRDFAPFKLGDNSLRVSNLYAQVTHNLYIEPSTTPFQVPNVNIWPGPFSTPTVCTAKSGCNCSGWKAIQCAGGNKCGAGFMYKTRGCPNNCATIDGCFADPVCKIGQ